MNNIFKELGMIYESNVMKKTLASQVQDTLEWLLPIEDLRKRRIPAMLNWIMLAGGENPLFIRRMG